MAKDAISAGFGTEYLGGASNEVRIRQPGQKLKGTEASKPPAWLAAHPDTGRYPNHKLVDIQPATSDTVDLIYEAIPTTPKIEESIDAELGLVLKYTYRNKYQATLPTIGATTINSTTLTSGDYVYRAAENLIGGVMAEVVVTVVTPASAPTRDKTEISDIYGSYTVYEKFVRNADVMLLAKGATYSGSNIVLNDELVDTDGTFGTRKTTTIILANCPERDSKTTDKDFATAYMYEKFVLQSAATFLAIGDAKSTYRVRSCKLKDEDGTFATLETIAVDSATGILKVTKVTDKDYGYVYLYRQWGLSSRSLPAIGDAYGIGTVLDAKVVDDDGYFAEFETTVLPSETGTQKEGSEIDKIFCISQTITQKVPSSTDMTLFYRGATYLGKYVLDAKLTDDDGTNATLTLQLTNENSVSFTEYQLDLETGLVYPVTSNYTIGTYIPTGMDMNADAVYRETKRLDCNFWVSTTSKTTTLTTESYAVVVPGKWPEVLLDFSILPIYDNNGYVFKYICDYNTKKAYIGNCDALYTRTWSKAEPTADPTVTLIPESVYYNGIFISFSIPSTLHFTINITETTGTSHPDLAYAVNAKTYPATNYIDWPASIIQDCNIERYKGGFTKETLLVYAPS